MTTALSSEKKGSVGDFSCLCRYLVRNLPR
nr:hypothetical protein HHOCTOMJ_HHOCTOMJ_CDS_0005 [Microvirus sp.]